MDIPTKIRLAETYAKMSESELARKIGTTPQALGQRIKTGKFSSADLDNIAAALGAEFICSFKFPDGTEI
ncbi:XRE family transcriptional regulator [Intestinimonas butyriciproducens]|uniref:XRE family transcriptional regulator n=1 Tax=Intestinimonas butyriciproducens TaxID=1297617 RepID=UPI001955F671|nr:XRE family transcriptional regulator [Intestinimonas butyriciproducens]MBM6976709.1 XRE family transcriptional regulator [Intestinimonas butyriciproducens]